MPENTPKQGRGCVFYGCLTAVLVFIGVILGIYFGTRAAVKFAVNAFTTNAPAAVPPIELTAAEQDAIAQSLEQRASLLSGANPAPLRISEKELNILLRQSPDLRPYGSQYYLRLDGTQLQAHVSMPLDQFGFWKDFTKRLLSKDLSGRYFNGTAVLHPEVTNGTVSVSIQDLLVNGRSLPGEFTGRLKNFNLTSSAAKDPPSSAVLSRIQKIEVRDSQLVIELSSAPAGPGR